jgi:hypothetical protein
MIKYITIAALALLLGCATPANACDYVPNGALSGFLCGLSDIFVHWCDDGHCNQAPQAPTQAAPTQAAPAPAEVSTPANDDFSYMRAPK